MADWDIDAVADMGEADPDPDSDGVTPEPPPGAASTGRCTPPDDPTG